MNTAWTNIKELEHIRGWFLYDEACPFCCACAVRLEPLLTRRGFDLAPLTAPWVEDCLDILPHRERAKRFPPEAMAAAAAKSYPMDGFGEMLLVLRDGQCLDGADAAVALARTIWWAWPLYLVGRLPFISCLLRAAYRWVATRRWKVNDLFPAEKKTPTSRPVLVPRR